jgi:hypothetical protein
MTRYREKGESELTEQAKREAARTGKDVCDILERMLRAAKQTGDRVQQTKIVQAQKFLGCRNQAKRRKRK